MGDASFYVVLDAAPKIILYAVLMTILYSLRNFFESKRKEYSTPQYNRIKRNFTFFTILFLLTLIITIVLFGESLNDKLNNLKTRTICTLTSDKYCNKLIEEENRKKELELIEW